MPPPVTDPTFVTAAEAAWIRYQSAILDDKMTEEVAFKETVIVLLESFEERFIEFYRGRKPS